MLKEALMRQAGIAEETEVGGVMPTLTGDHQNRVTDYTAICIQGSMIGRTDKNGLVTGTVSSKWAKGTGGPAGDKCQNLIVQPYPEKVANCLSKQPQMRYRLDMDNVVCSVDCRNMYENIEKSATLQSKQGGGYSLNYQNPVRVGFSVRRLTPLECERLQDYPDGWTDVSTEVTPNDSITFWDAVFEAFRAVTKKSKKPYSHAYIKKWLKKRADDSAKYKALGNSVAVCCPEYVLEGIKEVLIHNQIADILDEFDFLN